MSLSRDRLVPDQGQRGLAIRPSGAVTREQEMQTSRLDRIGDEQPSASTLAPLRDRPPRGIPGAFRRSETGHEGQRHEIALPRGTKLHLVGAMQA